MQDTKLGFRWWIIEAILQSATPTHNVADLTSTTYIAYELVDMLIVAIACPCVIMGPSIENL